MVQLEGTCTPRAENSGTLRVPRLATGNTPLFNELMCGVGKLLATFNVLEQEIKSATCFLLNPDHPDLAHPDIANTKPFPQRIELLRKLCEERLSPGDQDRINVLLDRAKVLGKERNFSAHSLFYEFGDDTFLLQKFQKKFESQVGTPNVIMARATQLETLTQEFADLIHQLFPAYWSWYRQATSSD
jgi:hypothetical protein